MTVLSCLTDSCDPKSHKKHLLEVFEWIHDILSVQLSSEVASSSRSPDMMDEEEGMIIESSISEPRTFEDIISDILLFTLQCLSKEDDQIKHAALKVNTLLQNRILDVVKIEKSKENSSTFLKIFETLQKMISGENNTTIYYSMKWIEHLIDNFPSELTRLSEKIIKNLNNEDLKIVEISVVLLSKIVNKIDSYDLIAGILNYLEGMTAQRKESNQTRSLLILKSLFKDINGEKLLNYFAKYLKSNLKKDFKNLMVQNLDMVINIEESLHGLRNLLKDRSSKMFDTIYEVWSSDPISCISVSLLSQRYAPMMQVRASLENRAAHELLQHGHQHAYPVISDHETHRHASLRSAQDAAPEAEKVPEANRLAKRNPDVAPAR